MNMSGAYNSTPYSDLDIDEARPVDSYLLAENNEAQIISPSVTDNSGDFLSPSSAVLAVSYKDGTTNDNGTINNNGTINDNGTITTGTTNNNGTTNSTNEQFGHLQRYRLL